MKRQVISRRGEPLSLIRAVSSPRMPNGVVVPAPEELEADTASFPGTRYQGASTISRQGASSIAGSFVQGSPPSAWTS